MSDEQHWLELPAGLIKRDGVLWVREPDHVSMMDVAQSFREGQYAKPFIHDDGEFRRLHFSLDSVQTEMLIDNHQALVFDYTQHMMGFLLFLPQPSQLVIVGLGGGSLTKFCYQQLPDTRITTLESDADVIGLSPLFEVPEPNTRNYIIEADAAEYFQQSPPSTDVVLIDGCDADGTAAAFFQAAFYENLKRALSSNGTVVVNLVGGNSQKPALIQTLTDCFGQPPIGIDLDDEKNHLLFAFRNPELKPDWQKIKQLAIQLKQRHKLDFPSMANKLQNAWPG